MAKQKRRTDGISYAPSRGYWYSSVTGNYLPLLDPNGKKIRGRENEAQAEAAYHLAIVEANKTPQEKQDDVSLASIFDSYLAFLLRSRAESSYTRARDILSTFISYLGADFKVSQLKRKHILDWLDSLKWADNTKARGIGWTNAALNYAVTVTETIPSNPIRGVAKQAQYAKTAKITFFTETQEKLAIKYSTPAFAQFITILIATGMRPFSEAAKMTASHLRETPNGLQIVFVEHKTARKGKTRIVNVISQDAANTLRHLAHLYPTGALLRTCYGNSWADSKAQRQMCIIRKRIQTDFGTDSFSCGKESISLYSARHTFAIRSLNKGYTMRQVAGLLGNTVAVCEAHYANWDTNDTTAWIPICSPKQQVA